LFCFAYIALRVCKQCYGHCNQKEHFALQALLACPADSAMEHCKAKDHSALQKLLFYPKNSATDTVDTDTDHSAYQILLA
jgi:hypothetical protein